jgi:hypothetical protein
VRKDFDQLFIANADVGGGGCSHRVYFSEGEGRDKGARIS